MLSAVLFFVVIVLVHVVPIWGASWLLLRWLDRKQTPAPSTAAVEDDFTIAGNFAPPLPEGHAHWTPNKEEVLAAVRFFTDPLPKAEPPRQSEAETRIWQGNLFSGKTAARIIEEDGWPVFDEKGRMCVRPLQKDDLRARTGLRTPPSCSKRFAIGSAP